MAVHPWHNGWSILAQLTHAFPATPPVFMVVGLNAFQQMVSPDGIPASVPTKNWLVFTRVYMALMVVL